MTVRVELLFLFTCVVCRWNAVCENQQGIDWSSYQKLQAFQIGLFQNKNLNKYVNLSEYSKNDNNAYIGDRTKVKRSYNTERCIQNLKKIQEASNDGKSNWANEILGTWGKVSSIGIQRDYGNFELCYNLEVDKSIGIETQYCVGDIDASKSNVGKITNGISTVGICIPNSCAPSLITTILNDYLNPNKSIQIAIPAGSCRLKNDNTTMFLSYIIFFAFLMLILGLVILCTIYDVICTVREERKNPVLLAFSVYSNGLKMFACKSNQSPEHMPCLDGIRAISALWIIAVHFDYFCEIFITNPHHHNPVVDNLKRIFILGRLCVDSFFVLSAMLATNKMLNDISKNGQLNIPFLYFQRILRISPALTTVALFNRYLLQFCASGPRNFLDTSRYTCEVFPWNTLLFFSNFITHECVFGSWYLATDMQLYLLTPFLVLLLHRYPKRFILFLTVFIFNDSFIMPMNKERFPFLRWLDSFYIKYSRITPWLIGVIFAYMLSKMRSRKHIHIPKYLNIFLIICSLSVLLKLGYEYAFVNGSADSVWMGRIWWSLSLCYIIFTCLNGQGGIINWFLSQPIWQPISRLSFNLYVIHGMVMVVVYSDRKTAWYLSPFTQVQELFIIMAISCAAAAVLAFLIEMPVNNLSHIFLYKKKNNPTIKE